MANDIDIKSGEPVLYVGINGKATYIPVGKPTPIPYPVFCVLKDNGFDLPFKDFDEGALFV